MVTLSRRAFFSSVLLAAAPVSASGKADSVVYRKIERLSNGNYHASSGKWISAVFEHLRADDVYRDVADKSQVYRCLSDAVPCEPNGNHQVEIERILNG